ncbi:MAG: carboxylesterase family protein [Betaproteobacteria bacterium]|nr:carboxylesterase family protein [Betaproteobacteria bacterium]
MFAGGTFAFAERVAALGRPAHVFRFDWSGPGNAFGACHCSEIPFVFNNLGSWQAPMLTGGDPGAMQVLAQRMQDAWIAFARTGDPAHPGLPAWPRFARERQTMLFDTPSRLEADPAGRARWPHWP